MGKWEMVRLGDVGTIITGNTPPKKEAIFYDSNDIPFFKPNDFSENTIEKLTIPNEYVSEKARKKIRLLPIGSVLVTCIGTIGKVGIVTCESTCNQQINAIIPHDKVIISEYLANAVLTRKAYLKQIANAPVVPIINKSNFSEVQIPLPPIDEQKRIAKNLDLASEIVKGYKEQLAELDKLVLSVFYEMFGDIKSNNKKWAVKPFSYCAIIDTRMTTDFMNYAEYPHIGIDSIEKNTGAIISYSLVKDSNLKSGKYIFDARHLIYSKIRPNLNKVAKPNFEGICSADAYPLLPTEQCDREYLAMVLRSDCFLEYTLAFSNRTNIPKINKSQLESFSFPLPPIDIQTRFASIVTEIETQKAQVQLALTEAESLFNSLMQEYFE